MPKDRRLILIFAIVFIDVVVANGLGALLTNYVVALPAKAIWLTGGTALTLGVQLALSPAIGHWSDKVGRRPVAIGAAIASLLSSFLLVPVQAWGYVANRVSKGGTSGLYAVMRSSAADIAEGEDLLKYSGILSFMVGGGAALGPMITGVLLIVSSEARIDPLPTVFLFIGLGVANVGLALLFRETNDKPKEKIGFGELKEKVLNAVKVITLWQQLTEAEKEIPGIKPLFVLNMLATLGFGYYVFFVAFLTQSDLNMGPLDVAYFFIYFGLLSTLANVIFFRYIATHVNKRKVIIGIMLLNVGLQVGYMFAESSTTLLYIVAGIDAITVSLIGGLIGGILTVVTKEGGGQGEMFGNIQALGGLASFTTAFVSTGLSGVSMIAPFIFCAVSSLVVVWWAMHLPDEAKKYSDRIEADQPKEDEQPQEAGA